MYLIFAYLHYYPNGGYDDLKDQVENLDKAIELIRGYCDHYDMVELCQIKDGKLEVLGYTRLFIDAIGVGGWLRELQKQEQEKSNV
jgi:hypothetical protein